VIELPAAPTSVQREGLTVTNSSPIDVFEDRSGVASLVICYDTGASVQAIFSATDDPVDASDSMSLDTYTIFQISKATRYMTLFATSSPASVYWYVV